jgi:hypothetical protein
MFTDQQKRKLNKVLEQFSPILLSDKQKPAITNKMEFSIDTGDNDPVFSPPRYYHPKIQRQIDEKFDEFDQKWHSPEGTIF